MTDTAIPSHLPHKLTISLWDFSWYTMTTPGEAYDDLDRAFAEAVERGYNTIRICAMPWLLFGDHQLDTTQLHFSSLGGDFGQRTRWYNVRGGGVVDGRQRLLDLFEAAKRHNCFVILSSWEYQQSSSFLATSIWYDALMAIPLEQRCLALADGMNGLISFLKEHELGDRIAYAELHNEVEYTKLQALAHEGEEVIAAEKPYLEAAIEKMRSVHPDILMTACYAVVPVTHMSDMAENMQVAHFHCYIYGVLRDLMDRLEMNDSSESFPTPLAAQLLRADAPTFASWQPAPEAAWRLDATGVGHRLFYMHDWADPDKWDLWLYEHYGEHRQAMFQAITTRLETAADWSRRHGVPAVIGEGYVGYTPLLTNFEEGPVGKSLAEFAVETCLRLNFWGIMLCSNSAPQHPFWQDIAWQKRMNARILAE